MARAPRLLRKASALRLRRPAPTIRLRLTALYGITFLITGAVLLTIGYALVRHNLDAHPDFRAALRRLGLPAPLGAGGPGRRRFGPAPPDARVVEAVRVQLRSAALHRLLAEYLVALGAMTVVSVGAGWWLAGRVLSPLRRITATAQQVSGENLGQRIALQGPADELRRLADTFDGMLSRLEAAFTSQRHFVASASHELRTPLAIMRTEVDVALADPAAGTEELRAMGEAVRETVDSCEALIESLLMLARSEARTGREEPVDLAALAADCVTDLQARAREREIAIDSDLGPTPLIGQAALLERMIANLIENGIRHNEPGGWLKIVTAREPGRVRLQVQNGGPVIDPSEAAHLVEPFRHGRGGDGGFGLGLSIVAAVVAAHEGALRVRAPGSGGLQVTIELPSGAVDEPAGVPMKTPVRALMPS